MRFYLSNLAERDLEEIIDYIARDNRHRAVTFAQELLVQCEKISYAPVAYPSRDNLSAGLRVAPYGDYLIFYRVRQNEMLIERILHGARDIAAVFNKGPLK